MIRSVVAVSLRRAASVYPRRYVPMSAAGFMHTVRQVEETIEAVEGFRIRFLALDGSDPGRRRVDDYPYVKAANRAWTVARWRRARFTPTYEKFEGEVLDGDGSPVHGKTLLANVRATYYDPEDEVEDDGGSWTEAELVAKSPGELKQIANELGVPVKPGATKQQVLDAIFETAEEDEEAAEVLAPLTEPVTLAPRGRPRLRGTAVTTDTNGTLDVKALEVWLWDAACQIRGPLDAPKFKDYILPLIFLKRLSDVFDDEVERVADEIGDLDTASQIIDEDHAVVRFYVPPESRWPAIALKTTGLGEALTDAVRAVARQNPRLQGVIDTVDFNATTAGQPIVDNDRLAALVKTLGQHRLGLQDVQSDLLGRAYEYLIRKFAEGQGQSAGEFYTPPEVARLMASILDAQPGMSVYDPCCGSAGLLIRCHLRLLETHGTAGNEHLELPPEIAPLKLFGQEINPSTFAMSRMNAFLHDMDAEIALGDTMRNPAFSDRSGHLRQFDLVTANPMWNQDFPEDVYRNDTMDRFANGIPPGSSADWGWVQHMVASLKPGGRMAIVLDTGSVSRGSGPAGANREREIRKSFVEVDLIEGVILLPENLFYNTSAPGIVVVLNRSKLHPGEILLVNASQLFVKGRPKNELKDEHVALVHTLFSNWAPVEEQSAVVTVAQIAANDYNLSPSRYVAGAAAGDVPSLKDAVMLLREADAARMETDQQLWSVLSELGVE
jgi:type I restriction enzyme M protein